MQASERRGHLGWVCSPGFSTGTAPCRRGMPPPALLPADCHPAQKEFFPSMRLLLVSQLPPVRKSFVSTCEFL